MFALPLRRFEFGAHRVPRKPRHGVAGRFVQEQDVLGVHDPLAAELHSHAAVQRLGVQQALGQRLGGQEAPRGPRRKRSLLPRQCHRRVPSSARGCAIPANLSMPYLWLDGFMRKVRVLDGEPLAVDLANTLWREHSELVDALVDLEGTHAWIDLEGIDCPATEAARTSLVAARTAIREHIDAPASVSARAALNAVLGWGFRRPTVTADGVATAVETAEPAQRAGWLAAANYADLLAAGSGAFRRCAHEQCVLCFYDASPRGSRRWCSMAGCGNRAKAARHYAKSNLKK